MQEKAHHGQGVTVLDSCLPLGNPQGAGRLEEMPSLLAVPAIAAPSWPREYRFAFKGV